MEPKLEKKVEKAVPEIQRVPKYQATVLAAGSVFEGTLRAKGDVDLACEFKGDIFAEGDVIIRTSLDGNVTGRCVELISCTLKGDMKADSQIKIHQGSAVQGNISTKNLVCSGQINGDVVASGHVVLEGSAKLTGNLTAVTLSMEEGAMIEGNLKVERARS